MTTADPCQRPGHEYEPADSCRACRSEAIANDRVPTTTGPARPATSAVLEQLRTAAARTTTGRSFSTPYVELTHEPTTTCVRCKGAFIDQPDHRAAHQTVFGHDPIGPTE